MTAFQNLRTDMAKLPLFKDVVIRGFFLLMILAFSGCSEEWWSRGQIPAPHNLLHRSEIRLDEASFTYAESRTEDIPAFMLLSEALRKTSFAIQERDTEVSINQTFDDLSKSFLSLEGKLSVTSRVPYSELCLQLNAFADQARRGKGLSSPAFQIFAARTNMFLARELSSPL